MTGRDRAVARDLDIRATLRDREEPDLDRDRSHGPMLTDYRCGMPLIETWIEIPDPGSLGAGPGDGSVGGDARSVY